MVDIHDWGCWAVSIGPSSVLWPRGHPRIVTQPLRPSMKEVTGNTEHSRVCGRGGLLGQEGQASILSLPFLALRP